MRPEEFLAHLDELPERSHNAELLRRGLAQTQAAIQQMKDGVSERDDALLLFARTVSASFNYASALPGATDRFGGVLEPSLAHAGILAPFVSGLDRTGRIDIRLPAEQGGLASLAMLDTLPEVLLALCSALACFWHYMNVRHVEGTTPSDDGVLVLTTMVIRSLAASEELRKAVDEGLAAMPGIEGVGASECTWLALMLRQSVFGWTAAVQRLVEDERSQQSLQQQQQERLQLLKACPDNAHGWLLYATSCLQFQQAKLAYVFSDRALKVTEKTGDQIWRPQLLLVRALAAALGGAGPTYVPRDAAAALLDARAALRAVATTWLPEPFHSSLTLGGFDVVLAELVLGVEPPPARGQDAPEEAAEGQASSQGEPSQPGEAEASAPSSSAGRRRCWETTEEEQQLAAAASDEPQPCKLDALFTTPVPKGVPPGAVSMAAEPPGDAAPPPLPAVPEDAPPPPPAGGDGKPRAGGKAAGAQRPAAGARGTVRKR